MPEDEVQEEIPEGAAPVDEPMPVGESKEQMTRRVDRDPVAWWRCVASTRRVRV